MPQEQFGILTDREMHLIEKLVILVSSFDAAICILNAYDIITVETYVNAKYMTADLKAEIKRYYNG